MRVVTWNVWWRFGGNWRQREPGIVAALADLAPDVVGLQEAWVGEGTSQAEVLGRALGLHAVSAPTSPPPAPVPPEAHDQIGIEVGVAVLSRWPVIGERRHRLPARHRPPPVALEATLGHPSGPLHVVSTCIEWEPAFADDHLAQARALAARLTDPALDGELPVLLMADLNAAPRTPQIRPLTDVMVDAWVAGGGNGDGVTLSSANPFAPREALAQIDRRIVSPVLAAPGRTGPAPKRSGVPQTEPVGLRHAISPSRGQDRPPPPKCVGFAEPFGRSNAISGRSLRTAAAQPGAGPGRP